MADYSENAASPQTMLPNSQILKLIDDQISNGFNATLQGGDYYVIRSEVTGVLSVLASSTVGDDKSVVFGPGSFKKCIEYVNSTVVTRLAETDHLGSKIQHRVVEDLSSKEMNHEPDRLD